MMLFIVWACLIPFAYGFSLAYFEAEFPKHRNNKRDTLVMALTPFTSLPLLFVISLYNRKFYGFRYKFNL